MTAPSLARRLVIGLGAAAAFAWTASPLLASTPSATEISTSALTSTLGAIPAKGAVVVTAGGASTGYATKVVVITQGSSLSFIDLDELSHTVTSVAKDRRGEPLFSAMAAPGSVVDVPGANKLAPGQYPFYCQFHPNMTGTLIVVGADSGVGGTVSGATPKFTLPLRQPTVLTGSHIHITAKVANVRVLPTGPKTAMWTYGGSYPGPTIRRPSGHMTKVTFTNHLPAAVGGITVHLHGDHHASSSDGQPSTDLISAGRARTYVYPLRNAGKPERAAFDFYHDHRMGVTGRNVWNGLQGMFITDDARSRSLGLPSGRYDVPLDVADRSFDAHNQLLEPFPRPGDGTTSATSGISGTYTPPSDSTVGTKVLVNGEYAPHLDVAAHRYRFRLLNGSNFSSYEFHLSDNQSFVQVGTGSGLLPAPVRRTSILLGPAQRADVVVDFHGHLGKRIVLESIPTTDKRPGAIGTVSVPIMQFRVTHAAPDHTRVPHVLDPLTKLAMPATPTLTWTFGLGGDLHRGLVWTVNNRAFDPNRADAYVELGSVQRWLLVNASPLTHYIHLHEEEWRTISRDGRAPPPQERGLEDVWRLDPGETVEVAAKVTDFTGLFMIHCHMLDHEDHGMMAQFDVVKPGDPHLHGLTAVPTTAPVGGSTGSGQSMAGMAGMTGMSGGGGGSMSGMADEAPARWMITVERLAWVLSLAVPGLVLPVLWRRRRMLERPALRLVSILALAGVGATHAADITDHLGDSHYIAVLFGALILVSGALAQVLGRSRRLAQPAWMLAAGMSGLTIIAFVISRTIGLPQIHDHIGMWVDVPGIASLVVETSLVVVGGWMCIPLLRSARTLVRVTRREPVMRVRLAMLMSTALVLVAGLAGGAVAHAGGKSRVLLVCSGTDKCPKVHGAHYYKSLQLAVDNARNNDWILVWPGTYHEAVEVDTSHGLTSGLHIRGMNRNSVVLNGRHQNGSGVHVTAVKNTWVENMTAEHYRAGSSNGFYWTGVDGYWGRYLTAYDNNDYGVYAYDSTSSGRVPAAFAYVYGSWNSDSGIYIGGCRDCHAVITNSQAEKNGIGYSGTNAGGELVIMNSEWDHNATGLVPNTLQSEPDPPQSGVTIVNNYVHDNNDGDVPGTGFTAIAPIGYGIDLAGGWEDIVRDNLITNQKHGGVVMHWLFTPPLDNQILYNRFKHVAYAKSVSDADIVLDGTSLQNCVSGNVDISGGHRAPASTDPPNLGNLQNCDASNPGRQEGKGIYEPGNPVASLEVLLNAVGITEKRDYKGTGPHPEAQKTMANPCAGVPNNAWCHGGKLTVKPPTKA